MQTMSLPNGIPRIIHQTWKCEPLPPHFEILAETWKEFHPGWEYKLWTDEMNRDFISRHFPDFLAKYDRYPRNIQRVDAFRYLLLQKEGGVYIDVDFECLRDMSPLLEGEGCVIGQEPLPHCERFGRDIILCNAWMAAAPGHPFMAYVCGELMDYPVTDATGAVDVLNSTGPFLLTDAWQRFDGRQEVRVLDPGVLYPLTIPESRKVLQDSMTDEIQAKIDAAHAVHYFFGGW